MSLKELKQWARDLKFSLRKTRTGWYVLSGTGIGRKSGYEGRFASKSGLIAELHYLEFG